MQLSTVYILQEWYTKNYARVRKKEESVGTKMSRIRINNPKYL